MNANDLKNVLDRLLLALNLADMMITVKDAETNQTITGIPLSFSRPGGGDGEKDCTCLEENSGELDILLHRSGSNDDGTYVRIRNIRDIEIASNSSRA